jgi:hypothetical protein
MSGLGQWYTPALSSKSTKDQLLTADRAELQVLVAVCDRALAMPRRLGGDATSADLANDKKKAKRLGHCFRQSLKAWGAPEIATGALDKEVRQRAAVVRWEELADQRRQWILSRFAPYVTLAIDEGQEQWGWTIVNLLKNELRWMDYALR